MDMKKGRASEACCNDNFLHLSLSICTLILPALQVRNILNSLNDHYTRIFMQTNCYDSKIILSLLFMLFSCYFCLKYCLLGKIFHMHSVFVFLRFRIVHYTLILADLSDFSRNCFRYSSKEKDNRGHDGRKACRSSYRNRCCPYEQNKEKYYVKPAKQV